MRVPVGAPLAWVWGVRSRALSHPQLPDLWAGCRGPLPTGYGCGGVWAWGPVTNPTARALATWLCALWGRYEGARRGPLLPGCGASGVGRSPSPDCPPSGRAAGAHYSLAVGAGGCGPQDPSPTPQCALFRAGFARCWGGTRAPRGARLLPGCGASGVGRSPTPDCPPSGRAAGAHYLLAVGAGGVRAWGPVTNPTARAPASWLCALWGRHEVARGGRLLPGCGASRVGPSPTPDCPPSGRAAGAHYPLAVGAGGCGCGDPSPTPQRALFRAGFARCGGSTRAPGGARLLPGCGASAVGRSPTPDCPPSGRAARAHYPLAVGAGGCGHGDPSQTPQRALLRAGFARCGGGTRAPGGAPPAWGVGRPVSGALPPPTARPLGGLPGPTTYWLWVRGGAGVGTRHQPHSARSFELALRAVGAARGRPGGRASCLAVGRPVLGALPPPTARPLGGLPGPTTYWLWVQGGCGRGDPSLTPQRALLRAGFARCGGGMRLPGGGASCLGVGRPGSGPLPPPTARPLGGLQGPTTHWLWVRGGAGVGIRHQPHSARSFELALRAVGAARGRPGGRASCLGVGRPLSGALPPPTARPLGGLPGPTTHWLWVRGGGGMGTRHKPHSARSCELALRAVGAARGRPGGRLLPGCGASGVGRSPTPDCTPSGRAARAHYGLAVGAWGCGRGDPSPTPQRALFLAGFARCGVSTRAPGGARLLPGVWGVRCRSLSHPQLPALWAGCRAPLPTGCGCRGVRAWGPVTNPTARSLASWLCALWERHEGARGAPLAWVSSVRGRALSHPRLPALWAGCRGPLPTGCGCGGVRAWGPVTNPTARALSSWLCALWGWHEGAWGGAPPAWVWGVRGRALSHPRLPALWAGCRGPLPTGCGCVGVRAWGPVTNPTARTLSSWLCALWGQHEGARGGAPPAWLWGVRCRSLPHPRLPALWAGCGGPPPTGCGCRGVGAWGPVTNPTARALASWLCALWERHEGARGGRLLPGCGASGVGRSPTPDCPPSGRAAGAHYPLAVGAGVAGVRIRHQPHSARSFELTLRAVGAARGRLGGGASCLGVGRPVSGALPPPTARPLGGLPGPTAHWLWVLGGAGVGTRHKPHSARSC